MIYVQGIDFDKLEQRNQTFLSKINEQLNFDNDTCSKS